MSVSPDDWREYQWRALSGTGAGSIGEQYDRHWRITVVPDGEAGSVTLTWAATGLVLDLSDYPANGLSLVLEPRGMTFGPLQFTGVQSIILEAVTRS